MRVLRRFGSGACLVLLSAAPAFAQFPAARVIGAAPNGFKVVIGNDTMVALNQQAAARVARMQSDLASAQAENERYQRVIAALTKADTVLEKAREDARTYIAGLEQQVSGWRDLAQQYKRLKEPRFLSVEGGLGIAGSDTKPAMVVGVGLGRFRVFSLLQESNVGGFVGAHLPIF